MKKLNGIAFVTLSVLVVYNPKTGLDRVDKHGKLPLIMSPVGGSLPDKRVIAGTIAERAGLISYDVDNNPELLARNALVAFLEKDESMENGRQFEFTFSAVNLPAIEQLEAIKSLGAPSLIKVRDAVEYEAIHNHSVARTVENQVVETEAVL